MTRTVFALALVLAAVAAIAVSACEPRVVAVQRVNRVNTVAVVETPAVVLTPVAVAVTVPQYTVGYDYQGQQVQAELQALRATSARLKTQSAQTSAPPTVTAQEAVPTPQPANTQSRGQRGLAVLALRCASCHDKAVADVKGGKNFLFDGGKVLDLDRNAGPMLVAMDAGTMPKGGKLTDAEFAAATWHLTVKEEESPKKP
jgi:mono/diheme cytochrome c family protein